MTPPREPARDPVLHRRAQAARAAEIGQRAGYGCFAAAVVLFVIALATGFPRWAATAVIAAIVAGSLVLAPAIVIGYAVRAAEQEDRPRGG